MSSNKQNIIDTISKTVIGQDLAVSKIAYYVDVLSQPIFGIDKYTLLLSGNSGTGKTLLAKEISKYVGANTNINIKFMSIVATEFSQEGYKGNSVATLANTLKKEKSNKVTPILFIDEIDKLIKSDLDFKRSTLDDFLSIVNENYVIMAGSFGNNTLNDTKTDIKSVSIELFTRIHDFIEFNPVNKHRVIKIIQSKLSNRYKDTDFTFLNTLLDDNKYTAVSYRDVSRIVYQVDAYIYNNGLKNAKGWLENA